ncbi:restriction endonuclease subunit S [Cellulomonas cellasea]|uniref:restriction endonuclease subunit S n=1 Tax=Cellulomonas cellasea TaxID=43670 RepID=UPI0025A41329|nr:restriction endonuclease subunit S [Cellulomonas cellasea]MDM8086422.1 restriction endonuclease subunit S [Cellulomonas cellasea]
MPVVPLGEIAEIVSGATPKTGVADYWGGDIAWATPADLSRLDGPYISQTPRQITEAGARSCATTVLPAGSVLLSSRAPIGHVAINTVPMATNQGFKSLVLGPRVHAKFLYYWLKSKTEHLQSLGNGATFKELSKKTTEQIQIPLPPVEEQRRVAAILDQADVIRTKRRQVLAHLDALIQSTFHAMFGDPTGDSWERAALGEVVGKIDNGTSPNCEARPAEPDEWGVLKLGAVSYGMFRPGENKAYSGQVGRMSPNEVRAGDVLMTRKNTRELVGAVAVVDDVRPRLLLPDLIFRLHLDQERVDSRYFQAMMMNERVRPAVRDLSSGSAASMPNISKARLRTLTICLPPIQLQRQFSRRIMEIRAQRVLIERARAADDELFASLQSRAFRGEL